MTNLKVFGNTYTNVKGIKATDTDNAIVTFGEGGGVFQDGLGGVFLSPYGGDLNPIYNWDFTQSLIDSVAGARVTMGGNCTQDSTGLHFTSGNCYVRFDRGFSTVDTTYEYDISEMNRKGSDHGRFVMINDQEGLCYRSTGYWGFYKRSGWSMSTQSDPNYFARHTLKIVFNSYGLPSLYRDNDLVQSVTGDSNSWGNIVAIGWSSQAFYDMTITAMRIYNGNTVGGAS